MIELFHLKFSVSDQVNYIKKQEKHNLQRQNQQHRPYKRWPALSFTAQPIQRLWKVWVTLQYCAKISHQHVEAKNYELEKYIR